MWLSDQPFQGLEGRMEKEEIRQGELEIKDATVQIKGGLVDKVAFRMGMHLPLLTV